eukprot:GILJ01010843.1.p1 GENE.GILJ01010843.1~~GILJ01010843.1.p1  ORF type:complete len:192 (+),score=14.34 GILJ01010843.1:22-597(+)
MSKQHVLVGVSGSVAAIKIQELVDRLLQFAEVKVVCTKAAMHFVSPLRPACDVLTDEDEWSAWTKRGDPVIHIELRRWADVLLLAPLSANTLAKLANGLCDNLLTCVCRAWDPAKPLLVAPAMNTYMWDHPFTAKHLAILRELGAHVIPPVTKTLVCGDTGNGALASVDTLVMEVQRAIDNVDNVPSAASL